MTVYNEKRVAERMSVLKTAKVEWGNSVVDCLVLEQSTTGLRLSMSIPMSIPAQVAIHMRGGAVRSGTWRWALGTEMGFEFAGIAKLDAAAAHDASAILAALREAGLIDIFARLEAIRFFDDAELRSAGVEGQAAMQRFEAALRQRAEGRGRETADTRKAAPDIAQDS